MLIHLIDKVLNLKINLQSDINISKEFEHINFCFQDETIKITDTRICLEFIEAFKNEYDKRGYHNWRLELENLLERYREYDEMQKFEEHYARALYEFFTKSMIKVDNIPNELVRIILLMMEYSIGDQN
ncbi:MAG: hypothetical protein IPG12_03155 [Saprospiraceae bacterium]|nr:hypothetical protein [Saprospiraceae bacterium]